MCASDGVVVGCVINISFVQSFFHHNLDFLLRTYVIKLGLHKICHRCKDTFSVKETKEISKGIFNFQYLKNVWVYI